MLTALLRRLLTLFRRRVPVGPPWRSGWTWSYCCTLCLPFWAGEGWWLRRRAQDGRVYSVIIPLTPRRPLAQPSLN